MAFTVSPVAPASYADIQAKMQTWPGMSPSTIKESCARVALLKFMGDGAYSTKSLDIRMGNAFGDAVVGMMRCESEHPDDVLAQGLKFLPPHFSPVENKKGKNFYSMYDVLVAVERWWGITKRNGWQFKSSEWKVQLTVERDDKPPAKLTGAYDIRLEHLAHNVQTIWDTKFVGSHFRYSWPTDPQVAFYTALSRALGRAEGDSVPYDVNQGGYLIGYVTETQSVLESKHLEPSIDGHTLLMYMQEAIAKYDVWVAALNKATVDEAIRTVPNNPYECCKNNWDCEYYSRCYRDAPLYLQVIPDDRRPERVVDVTLHERDLPFLAGLQTEIGDMVVKERPQTAPVQDNSALASLGLGQTLSNTKDPLAGLF